MASSTYDSVVASTLHGRVEAVEHGLKNGIRIDRDLIKAAVRSGSLPVLECLLNHGLDINHELGYMGSIVMYATQNGNTHEYVRYAFDHGADPNAHLMAGIWRGIEVAAMCADAEILRLWIEKGGQVKGTRALSEASKEGKSEVVQVLICEGGADVNEIVDDSLTTSLQRQEGLGTALHAAARAGHVGVVRLLLAQGSDPEIRNSQGMTAYDLAKENNHQEVIALLSSVEGGDVRPGMTKPNMEDGDSS